MKKPGTADRLLSLGAVLALVLAVGWMSYHDLRPKQQQVPAHLAKRIASEYFVETSGTPAHIPDDSLPVTIHAGEIAEGFTPHGMAPVTLPQRQVNLAFTLKRPPADRAAIEAQILSAVEQWKQQGNEIVALFIDYRPATAPDFKAYEALLEQLKGTPKTKLYHIAPTLDLAWVKGADYIPLKEHASAFLIEYDGGDIETFLAQTRDIPYAFRVKLPAGKEEQNRALIEKLKQHPRFGSAMQAIDSSSPMPEKEEPIRLWPKL